MKVRVVLSIEVDRYDWAYEHGIGESAREVSEDVKSYVLNAVQQAPASFGAVRATR